MRMADESHDTGGGPCENVGGSHDIIGVSRDTVGGTVGG